MNSTLKKIDWIVLVIVVTSILLALFTNSTNIFTRYFKMFFGYFLIVGFVFMLYVARNYKEHRVHVIVMFLALLGLYKIEDYMGFLNRPNSADSGMFINGVKTPSESNPIDLTDKVSVARFITSKTFTASKDNMTIKFYPEGYYELKHDYEVALTGKWRVGKSQDSSVVIYLDSSEGGISMLLSSDGVMTDTATSRVFQ